MKISLSKNKQLKMYEVMVRIRHFEERTIELVRMGLMPGRVHSYVGEEAVAAGACGALEDKDCIVSTHRGGGHLVARGADLRRLFAEYLGKATGYSHGKGGPMHMGIAELGVLCTNGIVGSGIPVAAGAALAIQLRKTNQVVLCFFGDGASNTGAFHEGLNLASIWNLPVIFLCENNQYGETMPISKAVAIKDIASRSASYGMPGVVVDGNAVEEVYAVICEAVVRGRQGGGPSLIEAKTYRIGGHFDGEGSHYRSRDEIQAWRKRDPIDCYQDKLLNRGVCEVLELTAIQEQIQEEVKSSAQQAINDPFPSLNSLFSNVRLPLEGEVAF